VVEPDPDAPGADLGHPPAVGAVILEQAAVHLVADPAPLEHAPGVEEEVEHLGSHVVLEGGVDGADPGDMPDPILGVRPERLEVPGRDLRRFGVARLAGEFPLLAHLEDFARLHGAEGAVPPDELGQRPDHDFPVPDDDGAFQQPFLERLGPADVQREPLGLPPRLGEQEGVVHVDLRFGLLPLPLQFLEPGGEDLDLADFTGVDPGFVGGHIQSRLFCHFSPLQFSS